MTRSASPRRERLTRWEIVGAWLGVWTAPKDLPVPPVPWRKLALGGLAGAALIALALALLIPPLERGKRTGAARLARQHAAIVAAEEARLRADQRIHRAVAGAGAPLLAQLERAITADAKARVASGKLAGPIAGTTCNRAGPHAVQYPNSRVYSCLVATASNLQGEGKDRFAVGYPFYATIYFATRRLVWCKANPQPGEQAGKGIAHVRLSPECAGVLSQLL